MPGNVIKKYYENLIRKKIILFIHFYLQLEEFRNKMGNALPRITNPNPKGKTEFQSLTELMRYIIDEDEKSKAAKSSSQNEKWR